MGRRSEHTREELQALILKAAGRIVARKGLKSLTTRRVTTDIGYTVGTLYMLYRSLDDLIIQLNTETLESLYRACRDIDQERPPEEVLLDLAKRYLRFVETNSRLWNALFEHVIPDGTELPARYNQLIENLLGMAVAPLARLVPGNGELQWHEARVLWSSLYGIGSLATSRKMIEIETPMAIAASLVKNYVAGLRAPR